MQKKKPKGLYTHDPLTYNKTITEYSSITMTRQVNMQHETDSCFCRLPSRPAQQRRGEHIPSLAEEFQNLSVQEREKVMDEIHGVVMDEIPETEAILQSGLHEMREELENLSRERRKLFDRALFLRPSLESDETLYATFLRGERYDAKKAASQLCRYFEQKGQLFPEEKLPCRITMEDLEEDDVTCIRAGLFHILPQKDRSGRTVAIFCLNRFDCMKHWKNFVSICLHGLCALDLECTIVASQTYCNTTTGSLRSLSAFRPDGR